MKLLTANNGLGILVMVATFVYSAALTLYITKIYKTDIALEGNWHTECGQNDFLSIKLIREFQILHTPHKLVSKAIWFQDDNCKEPIMEEYGESDYEINHFSGKIEATLTKTKTRYMNPLSTHLANAFGNLGYSDWKIGEYKETTAQKMLEREEVEIRMEGQKLILGRFTASR